MKWICIYLPAVEELGDKEDFFVDVAPELPDVVDWVEVAKERLGKDQPTYLAEGILNPQPEFFEIEESIGIAIGNLPYDHVKNMNAKKVLLALCREFEVDSEWEELPRIEEMNVSEDGSSSELRPRSISIPPFRKEDRE